MSGRGHATLYKVFKKGSGAPLDGYIQLYMIPAQGPSAIPSL